MNFKDLSIQKKMVFSIASIVLLILLLLVAITIGIVSKQVEEAEYEEIKETAKYYANKINTDMHSKQVIGQTMATFMENYDEETSNRDEIITILKSMLKKDSNLVGTFIGYESNQFDGKDEEYINAPGHDDTGRFVPSWYRVENGIDLFPLVDYDTSAWYTEPRDTMKDYINQAQLYEDILLMGYISPIIKNGKSVGVAGVDVELSYMDELVSDIKLFDSGYAVMMSNDGYFISANDKSLIGKATIFDLSKKTGVDIFNKIGNDVKDGKSGMRFANDPVTGQYSVFIYEVIETGKSSILLSVPKSEIMESVNSLKNTLILISVISILLLIGAIYFISGTISKPIKNISKEMKDIAKTGNLSKRVIVESKDEVGQMASSINEMLMNTGVPIKQLSQISSEIADGDLTKNIHIQAKGDMVGLVQSFEKMTSNLKNLITQIKRNAEDTAAAAEEMSSSSQEVNASMDQVSTTVQEVSKGAQETSREANNAQVSVESTHQNAEIGNKIAKEITTKMKEISETTKNGADKIKTLGDRSVEISKIVDAINNISEETNLLALNAAIEAARAGDAGRGFAVVADQVRKLAEESEKATAKISTLIDNIQTEIQESVNTMNQNTKQVEGGYEVIEKAVQKFEEIPSLIVNVKDSIISMASVAEENAASSEEVNASVEQVASAMQQVTNGAQKLTSTAENLREIILKFKV